jgi:hypothetical protein
MLVETVTKRCQWCRSWMGYEKRSLNSLSPFMSYTLAFFIESLNSEPRDLARVWVCPSCGRMEEVEL